MKLIPAVATALVLGATSLAANATSSAKFVGDLAPAASANRTVYLNSTTPWVNVTQGETVKFVANGREFTVAFDGVAESVNLQRFAPAGVLDHRVNAYVAVNPFDLPN
jgi:plastocyanin